VAGFLADISNEGVRPGVLDEGGKQRRWMLVALEKKSRLVGNTDMEVAAMSRAIAIRHVDSDGLHLVYLDQGDGPAVVMIPSAGRGAEDFDDLAARVAQAGFRVLRPQPRGIGGSRGMMEGLTLRDLAGDVVQVLNHGGVEPAVILGHAFGNRVARAVASYYPPKVSRILLLAAGGRIAMAPDVARDFRAAFDDSIASEARFAAMARAFFAPGNDAAPWRDGWFAATAAMQEAANRATAIFEWWLAGTAPVHIVQARQDLIAPAANGELLCRDLGTRAKLVSIDQAGHAMLPEQPDAIARLVVGILATAREQTL
jgi:pimeloyl-ACP methyl ester carboxylesterase